MNKMFPEIEYKSQKEILDFQNNKVPDLIDYVYKNSKFYQKHLKEAGISIQAIKKIDDLKNIPPTSKDDLNKFNSDFVCVDNDKIIDIVTTSGTLGDPVTFMMTDKDLDRLAYNEYISFLCAGGSKNDIYQLMTTIDRRFMAGLAYFL